MYLCQFLLNRTFILIKVIQIPPINRMEILRDINLLNYLIFIVTLKKSEIDFRSNELKLYYHSSNY